MNELVVFKNSIFQKNRANSFEKHDFYKPHYKVLSKLDLSKCDSLAPQLTNCISAHLIRIGYHSGGSIGWLGSYYIFGIFESNKISSFISVAAHNSIFIFQPPEYVVTPIQASAALS